MPPEPFLEFELIAERPSTPAGYGFVSASISTEGQALFLFVENPRVNEALGFHIESGARFPNTATGTGASFKLVVLGSNTSREIDIPQIDITFPSCDLFRDGRVLLAGARSEWRGIGDFDKNGVVFDPDSGSTKRILLGDGISDLCIDPRDRIWVSFFDEGVFGNFGWNGPGPKGPGSGGLVCFADDGTELWSFNEHGNTDFIDDCYALNADRKKLWVYYYSDFNICGVDLDFKTNFVRNIPVSGSSAFAVDDEGFLFSRQYQELSNTFHFVSRETDALGEPRRVVGRLPNCDWVEDCLIVGRGGRIHVLNERGWFAAEISELSE